MKTKIFKNVGARQVLAL